MNTLPVTVTAWTGATPPSEADLQRLLAAEGLRPYAWSNGPGDTYVGHTHAYHKVIYVVGGAITFGFPDTGGAATLQAGDRLDLPSGVTHDAVVGPQGVLCLEAHR